VKVGALCLRHRQQRSVGPHMDTAFRPAKTSSASWDAFTDVVVLVEAILAERASIVGTRSLGRAESRETTVKFERWWNF
jgi:hypothetical protein